jgi:hypothetical protein
MVAQAAPRLVELSAEMLFETGEEPEKTEIARVRFEDDIISIPDLDNVEAALRNILLS